MLLYHCYHFKYIELNMISLKSVVELLILSMWQTSSGIKEDNFDFVSKFDMLKMWSPSSLFITPNGKRGWPGHVSNAWKISYWEWNMSSLPHYWYDCSYICSIHCWYTMSIFFIFSEAWFWSNSLKFHRFGAQPPAPRFLLNEMKNIKNMFHTDILLRFFSLCKKWPVLVVLMKSYLIILQFWATQNKFLVSHPFNSEKWSARADSNLIFYFFLYRESWMKMAWFTKPSQFAWFTKPSQFATGSEHGAYTFELDNW